MPDSTSPLEALAAHLRTRRENILEVWRQRSLADARQHTAGALTRVQFNDHIPEVLAAFERKLRNRPGSPRDVEVAQELHGQETKHGQQRWQQGYRLPELLREWGHLHLTLATELDAYAGLHPGWSQRDLAASHHALIELINDGISESADQFAQMDRADASGRVNDLELALSQLKRLEHRRSQLIHQAVHDLRGDIQSVRNVAEVLAAPNIPTDEREEFGILLQEGVEAVSKMLADLMDLARLEAGQEHRVIEPFDAAEVLGELCRVARPMATARGLYLRTEGANSLPVEGDAQKFRRLLQNLLFNALKYTQQGGVNVSWGVDREHWWFIVKDTGPGLMAGPGAPLALSLRQATQVSRESEAKKGTSPMLDQKRAGDAKPLPAHHQPGEGIGLSIVKRLCDLLDASIELVSSEESGTALRVVLPRNYRSPGHEDGPGRTKADPRGKPGS